MIIVYGVLLFILMLPSWGVGSLMATIGKIRGWDTKSAFWISAILYWLLMIGAGIAVNQGEPIAMIGQFTLRVRAFYLLGALFIIGTVVSPLTKLMLRRRYPAPPKKLTSVQGVVKSEPSLSKQPLRPAKQVQSMRDEPVATKHRVTTRSGHIFVSYRRSDSADIAGRIYDSLVGKFGREAIFKDVDSIPLGVDFKKYLDQKVGECEVLLAIIGDSWVNASDSLGKSRLHDPADFVRIEIQSALQRDIPVIPLLVRGAQMPVKENLPTSLRKLVFRNGIPIRPDPDFHRDMDRLIASLEKFVRNEK